MAAARITDGDAPTGSVQENGRLPNEIIIKIIGHVFRRPWSATIDITCQLKPIAHTQVLRTSRFFNQIGTEFIKKSFTGEFIRHDRRGQIKNQNLKPTKWYQWIMQHTTALSIMDANFSLWFIPRYRSYYPMLESFRINVTSEPVYRNVEVEMPDYSARRARCDIKTKAFVECNYAFHAQLFQELTTAIYDDVVLNNFGKWPSIEYHFNDCRCHPERLTVFNIKHVCTDRNVAVFVDESFHTTLHHVIKDEKKHVHTAVVDCISVPQARPGSLALHVVASRRVEIVDQGDEPTELTAFNL